LREYRLDAKTLTRYKRRGVIRCPRCGEKFEVGQRVVSRGVGKRSHCTVLYHKECYEKTIYE